MSGAPERPRDWVNAATPTIDSEAPIDPPTWLAVDVACVCCGYNLRGLQPAGDCPECATPIASSLAPNLLRAAGPQRLGIITVGLVLAAASYTGFLVFAFLQRSLDEEQSSVFWLVLHGMASLSIFLMSPRPGWWMLRKRTRWSRMVARAGALVFLPAALIEWSWGADDNEIGRVARLLYLLIVGFAGMASLRYTAHLLAQTRCAGVAVGARLVGFGFPVFCVLLLVLAMQTHFSDSDIVTWYAMLGAMCAGLPTIGLSALVFVVAAVAVGVEWWCATPKVSD